MHCMYVVHGLLVHYLNCIWVFVLLLVWGRDKKVPNASDCCHKVLLLLFNFYKPIQTASRVKKVWLLCAFLFFVKMSRRKYMCDEDLLRILENSDGEENFDYEMEPAVEDPPPTVPPVSGILTTPPLNSVPVHETTPLSALPPRTAGFRSRAASALDAAISTSARSGQAKAPPAKAPVPPAPVPVTTGRTPVPLPMLRSLPLRLIHLRL